MADYRKTERTTLKRAHERGHYDRKTVHGIVDAALICHVAFIHDGAPAIIPTAHWREGDVLYIHGSSASRAIRALEGGSPACIEVTLTDALVLARSGYNSSIDYRSVIIYGKARKVGDEGEKLAALKVFMDKLAPGRWEELRPPTDQEMKATAVLAFDLQEVSAKVRSKGVEDDPEDMDEPVWAGIVPLRSTYAAPEPAPDLKPGIPLPDYLKDYKGPV